MGSIVSIAGPLVMASGIAGARVRDAVRVSGRGLVGEIVELRGDLARIYMLDECGGLQVGDEVNTTGAPLSIELGPGMLGRVFDGILRPLDGARGGRSGNMPRGMSASPLKGARRWAFEARVHRGDRVSAGDVIGVVQETPALAHCIMVPPGVSGRVLSTGSGERAPDEVVATIAAQDGTAVELTMAQRWPVRRARPVMRRAAASELLATGMRALDSLLPLVRGGVAAVPGAVGSGKTTLLMRVAEWVEADVVVYVGCGARGSDIAGAVDEFARATDLRTGRPLMERMVVIASPADAPAALRGMAMYTGMTVAEYFRDMGYSAVVVADSASWWAEALREMSIRLGQMPGEEGYPADMAGQIAGLYGRAGCVECAGRTGAVSVIAALSPMGGDMLEPVCQAAMRASGALWAMSAERARRLRFPAIDMANSYSLYARTWAIPKPEGEVAEQAQLRAQAMELIQALDELGSMEKLVGRRFINEHTLLRLEVARMLEEDFICQDAQYGEDARTAPDRQRRMLQLILRYFERGNAALEAGVELDQILSIELRARIGRARYVPDGELGEFDAMERELDSQLSALMEGSRYV